jgi:hypothetical protein
MDDYRKVFAELEDIDAYFDKIEDELEMDKLAEWICVDRTNWSCTFMNRTGEVRCIGSQYIDDCFGGEQWQS